MSTNIENTTNNNVVIDNKELQQANNNNAAASASATVVDNKSASQVAISSMFSPSPIPSTEASIVYACANLKAATLGAGAQTQRPIHLVIAQDVSGSMSGSRLTEAQESLRFVVEQLRDVDSLGIVTFSDSVGVAIPLTKMNANGKEAALRAINALRATGSTNLSGGLFAAHNMVTGGHFVPTGGAAGPQDIFGMNISRRPAPNMPPAYNAPNLFVPPPPTAAATPAPAPQTIPVVIGFALDTTGNNPAEKYRYKLSIIPPSTDDKISKFTIHDPENRFADILGSGETEYDLKPVSNVIQNLEISFDLVGSNKPHKVNFFMGEAAGAKRTVQVPLLTGAATTEPTTTTTTTTTSNQVDDGIVRCVFLFTDGHANVGIQNSAALVAETKKCLAASPRDATIFTFGFGANHNAEMLQSVATSAEGLFYFIENTDMMPETFADCLGGICSTVATNVKVTAKLTPGCGVRFSQAMTKFKTEIHDDGNTLIVKMKDLYSEEKRDILLELKVDGPTAKAALVDNINNNAVVGVSWTLEYSDATKSSSLQVVTLHNTTKFIISSDSAPVVNAEVDELVQRFKSIEVMEKVREAADAGRLKEARDVANAYSTALRAAPSACRAGNMMIQQQMQQLQDMALDSAMWSNKGSKQVQNYAQSHALQRGNAVTDDCAYEANEVKMEFRKKAMKKG